MTTAVILAGGLGTRLRSAVPNLPKPMAPIRGRPFLEHLIDHWICQGIDRFILSVGYRREVIIEHFSRSYRNTPIDYAIEETPLGTGGALLKLAPHLPADERFLLLNGDTFFDVPLPALQSQAETLDADWCFSLFRAGESGRYMGLQVQDDGRITKLQHDDRSIGRLANGGVYVVHPRALRSRLSGPPAPVSLESDLLPAWLEEGQRLFGLPCNGSFIDIGVPHDYHRASTILELHHDPSDPSAPAQQRSG